MRARVIQRPPEQRQAADQAHRKRQRAPQPPVAAQLRNQRVRLRRAVQHKRVLHVVPRPAQPKLEAQHSQQGNARVSRGIGSWSLSGLNWQCVAAVHAAWCRCTGRGYAKYPVPGTSWSCLFEQARAKENNRTQGRTTGPSVRALLSHPAAGNGAQSARRGRRMPTLRGKVQLFAVWACSSLLLMRGAEIVGTSMHALEFPPFREHVCFIFKCCNLFLSQCIECEGAHA